MHKCRPSEGGHVLKNKTEFIVALGESVGAVLAMSVMYGIIWFFIKTIMLRILKYIGIDYFSEIKSSYEWIGESIIESRAIFNADKAAFYRLSNGKYFVEADPLRNVNIKIESICSATKNRGISQLPDTLDDRYYQWFQQIESENDLTEFFTADLPAGSQLRNELIKNDIYSYLGVKIRRGKELYGIVIYTWSNVHHMPKQFIPRYKELIEDIKSVLLDEVLFIISRSPKFRVQSVFKSIFKRFK